jgi:hypothetical protein
VRNADFTRYLTARFLGSIAVQMQTVAVGWQHTRSRAILSTLD